MTAQRPPARDARLALFSVSAVVVLLDRLTKHLVNVHVPVGHAVNVITGVFRISHVLNTGAAFSLFADGGSLHHTNWGLVAFSAAAIIILTALLLTQGRRASLATVSFALILGGAIGNLYDRLRFHSVTDFLEVHIARYHWPDFNLADSCITVAACLLVVDILIPHRHAD
jgi:signal peptidase II